MRHHAKLRAMIAACLIAIAAVQATPAPAQGVPTAAELARSTVTSTYEMVKVAEGVYSFIPPEAYGAWVSGNTTVVIGDSSALVVDPGHFPLAARRIIADIKRLTNRPVRYVVNTHWHPDHWTANSEYTSAFPGATIVSTGVARRMIAERGPDFLRQYQDSAGGAVEVYRQILREGKSPFRPGSPLSDDERRGILASVVDGEMAIRSWRHARLVLPTLTFDDSLTVDLGGREARIVFLGRGNTAGDALVHLPESRIVVAGDLVVHPVPYAYGSFIGDWVTTMNDLKALEPVAIVPGHGPVQRDLAFVDLVIEALNALQSQVSDGVRKGQTLNQIRESLDLARFERAFVDGNPLREGLFQVHFVGPALTRAYTEARYNAGRG